MSCIKVKYILRALPLLFLACQAVAQGPVDSSSVAPLVVPAAVVETPRPVLSEKAKERYGAIDIAYFTSLEEASKNPDKVYKLKLSGQSLTSVPAGLSKFKNLVLLDLSNNQIAELSSELSDFPDLIELNLGNNKLASIPAQLCSMGNLQSLYLNSNDITTVGAELACLVHLQKLFLQNNEITSVSSDIGKLKELRTLSLFGNALTKVPDEVSDLSHLQVLLVNNNKLTDAPKGLEKLEYLKYYSDAFQNSSGEMGNKKRSKKNMILNSYDQAGVYSNEQNIEEQAPAVQDTQAMYSDHKSKTKKKLTVGKAIRTNLLFTLLLLPVFFLVL